MIKTKEETFLAEMGIHTKTIIEGDYTAKYKLKDLLKKYAEQCNIANVVGQSEQLVAFLKWVGDGYDFENNAEKIVKIYIDEGN